MFRFRGLTSAFNHAHLSSIRQAIPRRSYQTGATLISLSVPARRNHSSSTSRPKLCPSCASPLSSALPVCTNCSYIAPIPESMTYHEMLGASYDPNPFVLDVSELKNQFRRVQAVVHPDRWVAKPQVSYSRCFGFIWLHQLTTRRNNKV